MVGCTRTSLNGEQSVPLIFLYLQCFAHLQFSFLFLFYSVVAAEKGVVVGRVIFKDDGK